MKKTPEGKRRRSELEKIMAKNAYYKKLKEDREFASKQCPVSDNETKSGEVRAEDEYLKPSQVFLEDTDVLENTGGELDDCGKFMASIYLVIQVKTQIVHAHGFVIVLWNLKQSKHFGMLEPKVKHCKIYNEMTCTICNLFSIYKTTFVFIFRIP